LEIESRDPGHAWLGLVLWSLGRKGPSAISTKFEADSLIHSKVIRGSHNLEIGSHDPGHAHIEGSFMVYMQEGTILYLYQISNG